MKTRILFSLLLLMVTSVPITAQIEIPLNQITLYWHSPPSAFGFKDSEHEQKDASRSAVNFETGARGPATRAYHLKYGGTFNETFPDQLSALDCQDMIVGLGAKEWRDFKETPPSPFPKTYGRSDICLFGHLAVEPGQMYLMRMSRGSLRGRKVIYAMFRVDSLVTRDHCVLSWKLVKPPNVDDDEKWPLEIGRRE